MIESETVEAEKDLGGKTCIHLSRSRGPCRKAVERDGPNGWLCMWHQQVVIAAAPKRSATV